MARVYATRAELVEYAPADVTVPADAEATRQLARASERVEVATRSACYAVDADGMPTDPDVVAGMRDAVCALVVHWITTGDEDGAAGVYSSVGIGSITLQRAATPTAGDIRGTSLPDAVRTHLELAGLLDATICQR